MGFWQGGEVPFGMARQLVSPNGEPKQILKPGEWKNISTDRVVLTPGDSREVETTKLAFDLYTKQRKTRHEIAEILNQRSMLWNGHRWTVQKLLRLFTNRVYKGDYVYGKHFNCKTIPRDKWLIREHSFRGVISEEQWAEANARAREEVKPLVDSEMIEALRRLWKRKGKLSTNIVNAARGISSIEAYKKHFGGINEAYRLIGYPVPREYSYVHAIKMMRQMRNTLCDDICEQIRAVGGNAERQPGPGILVINGNVRVRVTFSTRTLSPYAVHGMDACTREAA